MNRKHLIIWIAASMFVVLVISLFAIAPLAGNYIEQKTIAIINNSSTARVSFEDLDVHLRSLEARRMKLYFPRLMSGLELEDVEMQLSILSLLSLTPRFDAQAKLYSGKLQSDSSVSVLSADMKMMVSGQNVKISQHPLLNALGISSGKLNFDVSDLQIIDTKPKSGKLDLTLSKMTLPKEFWTRLDRLAPGLKLGPAAQLAPEVGDIELNGKIRLDQDALHIESFKLDSSLGAISGHALLVLDQLKGLQRVNLRIETDLKKDGALLMNLLRQAPGVKITKGSRVAQNHPKWRLSLDGSLPAQIQLEAL